MIEALRTIPLGLLAIMIAGSIGMAIWALLEKSGTHRNVAIIEALIFGPLSAFAWFIR